MIDTIFLIFGYVLTAFAAFALLLRDTRLFRLSICSRITNGDVAMMLFVSAMPVIGLVVALLVTITKQHGENMNNWADRPNRFFNKN